MERQQMATRPLAAWDCFKDSDIGPVATFVQNISHSSRVMEADSSPTYDIFLSDGLGHFQQSWSPSPRVITPQLPILALQGSRGPGPGGLLSPP